MEPVADLDVPVADVEPPVPTSPSSPHAASVRREESAVATTMYGYARRNIVGGPNGIRATRPVSSGSPRPERFGEKM
jgi:hypothetical protein